MGLFDFLNNRGVQQVKVRDISNVRGLPPARGGVISPRPARPQGGFGNPLLTGLSLSAITVPTAIGVGNYLRSPQGQLVKDRLNQFDIPGAFTALTGIGKSNAPRLTQYNPPGFDSSRPVSTKDLLDTAKEVGNITGRYPVTNAPAERAYQQEKARVAQLTAQDPELQRYENARKAAKTQEEMNAARDIGMQMWAKANPKLAAKVGPGQSGYEAIQRTLNAGQMGAPAELPAFAGAQPSAYLGTSGAPSTSSYQGVKPTTLGMGAIGPNALTNAYNMQTASQFTKFTEGPTLSSQPLGNPTASVGDIPTYSQLSSPQSYDFGSIQGEDEAFGTEAAQKLAQSYVKNLLNFSPR